MDWPLLLDPGKFVLFALILTRLSGLVMIAPIYGTSGVPAQVRALVAVALAWLILPSQWGQSVPQPATLVHFLLLVGSELVVGLSLGLALVVLLSGIELAGQLIGQTGGLMAAEVFDPTQASEVPLLSRLLSLVLLAIFVAIGGHRIVMGGLLDTLQTIPPGSAAAPSSLLDTLVMLVSQSFALGIRAAAPALTALLLANLLLGLIGRTLPQLNILVVGFGLNTLLALGALLVSLGAAVRVFEEPIAAAVQAVLQELGTGQ
ncbi:MAG: flagellar biosynthetic protein FliR [Thermoguttaceae bacterium]